MSAQENGVNLKNNQPLRAEQKATADPSTAVAAATSAQDDNALGNEARAMTLAEVRADRERSYDAPRNERDVPWVGRHDAVQIVGARIETSGHQPGALHQTRIGDVELMGEKGPGRDSRHRHSARSELLEFCERRARVGRTGGGRCCDCPEEDENRAPGRSRHRGWGSPVFGTEPLYGRAAKTQAYLHCPVQ